MDLAKHAGYTNSGDYKSNWIKSNLAFWETRVSGEKNPKNRVEKQQIQSTYDSGSGYRTRAILVEGEYHCANTAHVFNNINKKLKKNTPQTNLPCFLNFGDQLDHQGFFYQ